MEAGHRLFFLPSTDKKCHTMTKKAVSKSTAPQGSDKNCHQEALANLTKSPYTQKGITTDEIVALKVANPNLSLAQAATILGCDKANIIQHLHRIDTRWVDLTPTLDRYKRFRADVIAYKQMRLLANLTEEKQREMGGLQLATAFGILYDKERLERGQSTSNVAYADLTQSLSDIEAEIAKLEAGGATDADFEEDLGMELPGEAAGPDGLEG